MIALPMALAALAALATVPPTVAPVRNLSIVVRMVGKAPTVPSWNLPEVEAEACRLLRPAGVVVRIQSESPLVLDPSVWDLDSNGRLDLWRDEGPFQASPEEAALRKVLRERGMVFPQIALFQDSFRLGWAIREPVHSGDTLLHLASSTALPWRDRSGRTVRYSLEGPRGERAESFSVTGYPTGGLRVQAAGARGGWRRDHPATDLVVRPDAGVPAFGSTDRNDGSSPSIVFLEPGAMGDALRCARVLVHELCHGLGLPDTLAPDNLMSAVLHMDVESPRLTPDQVRAVARRLDASPRP